MPKDLLYPSKADESKKHKLKRLIQSPNSFFMDVKCPGCFQISTVFSHAQVIIISWPLLFYQPLSNIFMLSIVQKSVVLCVGCASTLCQPTGGKCRLTEGCSFRKKVD